MWNQQWHTNFCVAYTRNPEFLQVSIEIEYNGVIFNKVFFGEDQYQCSTRGPFESGASSDNILSNTPIHHQCPLQHQTAWRRRILKQWHNCETKWNQWPHGHRSNKTRYCRKEKVKKLHRYHTWEKATPSLQRQVLGLCRVVSPFADRWGTAAGGTDLPVLHIELSLCTHCISVIKKTGQR